MRALVDLVFPPACVSCARAGHSFLCPPCLAAFPWIVHCCERCGSPSAQPRSGCADCRDLRPAFRVARAAAVYDGVARDALMTFKLGGERRAARHLAATMLDQAARLEPDVVTFVPAMRAAVAARGYNTAEELARHVARALRRPLRPLVRKVRATKDQAGLSKQDRRRNQIGAYRAAGPARGRILLVDDVLTTGATADACARALAPAEVMVVTFARAP